MEECKVVYITNQHMFINFILINQFIKCNGVGLGCPVVYLIVHDLPRGADVEWHFVATKKTSDVNCK